MTQSLLATTQKSPIDLEGWVLGGCAYELNPSVLDIRQEEILLRFIEPVHQRCVAQG